LTDIHKAEHRAALTRDRQERRLKGGAVLTDGRMILICLCVAHVTAIMIICVGPTAVGNVEQTTVGFVNMAVDKLLAFRPVCLQTVV